MNKVEFNVEQDTVNDDVMLTVSGKDLVINLNTFFGVNSVITFIPKDQIHSLAIQLGQISEDIMRTKDLKDGKAGEELRSLTPLEKERVE
jgi:hypothetical protein